MLVTVRSMFSGQKVLIDTDKEGAFEIYEKLGCINRSMTFWQTDRVCTIKSWSDAPLAFDSPDPDGWYGLC